MDEPLHHLTLTMRDIRLLERILLTYPAKPDMQAEIVHLYERLVAYLQR